MTACLKLDVLELVEVCMSSRLEVGKDCGCLESCVCKEVNAILDWGKIQVSSHITIGL